MREVLLQRLRGLTAKGWGGMKFITDFSKVFVGFEATQKRLCQLEDFREEKREKNPWVKPQEELFSTEN